MLADTDPDALADVLRQWAAPRFAESSDLPALAADGKRIRGANRHAADGARFETATLVTHGGRPLASRCRRDEGGETAAARALLDDVDMRGCVPALDALHACADTGRAVVDIHGADHMFDVKANCPDTFALLETVDRDAPAVRRHADGPAKGHGRVETRSIAARDLLPGALASFAHARQAFRVIRERTVVKTGATSTETACGITSVDAGAPAPTACRPGTAAAGRRERQPPPPRRHPRRGRQPHPRPPRAPDNATLDNIAPPSSSTAASATCPRRTSTS